MTVDLHNSINHTQSLQNGPSKESAAKNPIKTSRQTTNNRKQTPPEKPSELRNNVYDKIIEETCFILSRGNANRPLGLNSAFARVSKDIRSEFLPLALKTIPVIKTEVRNWDFGHVVNSMNRIGHDEMERLAREQRVVVDLWFSGENADPSGLMRWLERFDDDERRGDGVTFEYVCTKPESSRQNWDLARFRACTSGGPKGSMQFEKIAGVLGAWN
jgi:hypothetical protein